MLMLEYLVGVSFALALCPCVFCTSVFKFERPANVDWQAVENEGMLGLHDGSSAPETCGYQSCKLGKPDMVNVHIVPHTHDDVGWLKTVDQYYYGAHNEIQHAGVQYILDTVMAALQNDPVKRFIYVEIAFFSRWWNEQHDSLRHMVKRLVNEGRLEFILGGWCMNDEASTHYTAIIDQHTLGFRFLQQNFGDCARPKIGWQIDPFGHSREQASLFAQFGFDGLFFGRLDYQDKNERLQTKTMEHMWFGSENLGGQAALLTGVNFNGYGPPKGFCFDVKCKDVPIMDDPDMEDYNVDVKVNEFLEAVHNQAQHYTTNHILITMGSDFQFENAHENFKNVDKLIKYVNQRQSKGSQVNLLYSTPSCYLYALNQANQTYTAKRDDFFPYASRENTFWTGYFTSRPALKGYARECSNFLQTCKQLDVLSQLDETLSTRLKINKFRKAVGIAQHHDAISGTEKQNVSNDYAKRLAIGVQQCQDVVGMAYSKLLPLATAKAPNQQFCNLLNISFCPASERNSQYTVLAYNPVARPVSWTAYIPVTSSRLVVLDADLKVIKSEVVPLSAETRRIPGRAQSASKGNLVFTSQLPPLGFKTFFVSENNEIEDSASNRTRVETPSNAEDFLIKNEFTSLTFDGKTHLLKSITNLEKKQTLPLEQSLRYYKAFNGNNTEGRYQSSGAYIFRPNGSDTVPAGKGLVQLEIYKGNDVQEVRQVFSDWASQVVRLTRGQRHAEIEWTVGPLPINDGLGKEVISLFKTDMKTNGVFYTDSNGREILKRIRDYRPTWKLNQTEEVAGNYYPVNTRIYMQDLKKLQLTVLTDRSQGGASIKDGQLELMVHRRTLVDDAFGVGEALNETGISGEGLVVRGKHYVLFDSIQDSAKHHRALAERLFQAPQVTFAPLSVTPETYKKSFRTLWSGVKTALPANVHLLSLEEWEGPDYLLRLEHFYEKGEDAQLSKPASVSLKNLFSPFSVAAAEELTLGANQKLSEAKRLQWNVQGQGRIDGVMQDYVVPMDQDSLEVILKPMQIRTFRITIQANDVKRSS